MKVMDKETFEMVLDTLKRVGETKLPLDVKLEFDRIGDFPKDLVEYMLSPELALHLVFIPEEFGGLGAGCSQIAIVSEEMAKIDLAVATSFLAICLGMDPLRVGATPEQKEKYIGRIAEEGLVVAYGVTEPNAGSNVQSLKTKAERVLDNSGNIVGYKINGQKQFITNGGVANLYTILADAPDGPSFFVVESGTAGLIPGKHEDKHGIRASDTCPLTLDDMYVPVDQLIGGVEGQGLKQANEVFGYTRLMVATFGLGGGVAALERAVAYSKERVQFGTLLCEKEGYTHKLLVPHAVKLEAARAYIEHVGARLDSDESDLQVEGSIAKYFATEAGDAAANDAIQSFGGYGYMRECEVEKIKRDVKILTIYEGTSEIQQNIISLNRMREVVRTKGEFYENMAKVIESKTEVMGDKLASVLRLINRVVVAIRANKLNKSQHTMFLMADMMVYGEIAVQLCLKALDPVKIGESKRTAEFLKAAARLFIRDSIATIFGNANKIFYGSETSVADAAAVIGTINIPEVMSGRMHDMNIVKDGLIA